MKKFISKILRFFLPVEMYENRRQNIFFIFYSNFELFIRTLKLRFKNRKIFFLPSKHIGAIFLLDKINVFFKKQKINFFLWDASLLGAIRKQNAIAGSASDIDLAIIFNKKKHLKCLRSLKDEFKIKFHNNYNSIQLFHYYGIIDISLINKKQNKLKLLVDIPEKKRKFINSKKKRFLFKFDDFCPFLYSQIYSKKFCIPKKYKLVLEKVYGPDWKTPDKKEQVYFN